ncbi:septum formation family protein [Streptomyces sp. NPDC047981]|uniref:septum formation family protein n=1 Tax=Streptomyces sp. NPDC047981 TaxID=3154610 RepID=UPI00342E7D55
MAAALAASLLLTACEAGGAGPEAAPSAHPVFDQPLERQVLAALRQTQEAGNASFTQTLTFESKNKGRAVQTVEGRIDFAKGLGEAKIAWKIPREFDDEVKNVILGRTPGRALGDTSGSYLIDRERIRYRAQSSPYWLVYGAADIAAFDGADPVEHLRGTESPVGGMLLEGISGAAATEQRAVGGGRSYKAELPEAVTQDMFPADLNDELSTPLGSTSVRRPGHPLTVSVDARGRITHSRVDLSRLLGENGVFAGMTSLTMDLTLSRHGASRPAMAAEGKVRLSAKTVRPVTEVEAGGCVDFNTGQRDSQTVVDVDCRDPHDGRVWAQKSLGEGPYPGSSAAKSAARTACREAYDSVPSRWTGESSERRRYWFMWSSEREWDEAGEGRVTCYVVTRKGAA